MRSAARPRDQRLERGRASGHAFVLRLIASKAALDAFTRVAAGETRLSGVRFTTVHMPLVRTPMILPTEAYREAPALTPEQAADMVLGALVTRERLVGTRFAQLLSRAHVLMPELMEQLLSLGHDLGRVPGLPSGSVV